MAAHALPDFDLSGRLLAVWMLRVAIAGRSGCPALEARLKQELGEDAPEAAAQSAALALAILRGGGRLWDYAGPAGGPLAPFEEDAVCAIHAAARGDEDAREALAKALAGPYWRVAEDAVSRLAGIFLRHGLESAPEGGRMFAEFNKLG